MMAAAAALSAALLLPASLAGLPPAWGGGQAPAGPWDAPAHAAAAPGGGVEVLNPQSHPEVGGQWAVRVAAPGGPADLTVSGADGTALGGADLAFARSTGGEPRREGGSLVFEGWAGPGEVVFDVLTPGRHNLVLERGGAYAAASNQASGPAAPDVGVAAFVYDGSAYLVATSYARVGFELERAAVGGAAATASHSLDFAGAGSSYAVYVLDAAAPGRLAFSLAWEGPSGSSGRLTEADLASPLELGGPGPGPPGGGDLGPDAGAGPRAPQDGPAGLESYHASLAGGGAAAGGPRAPFADAVVYNSMLYITVHADGGADLSLERALIGGADVTGSFEETYADASGDSAHAVYGHAISSEGLLEFSVSAGPGRPAATEAALGAPFYVRDSTPPSLSVAARDLGRAVQVEARSDEPASFAISGVAAGGAPAAAREVLSGEDYAVYEVAAPAAGGLSFTVTATDPSGNSASATEDDLGPPPA